MWQRLNFFGGYDINYIKKNLSVACVVLLFTVFVHIKVKNENLILKHFYSRFKKKILIFLKCLYKSLQFAKHTFEKIKTYNPILKAPLSM